jgi:hypothetical protein
MGDRSESNASAASKSSVTSTASTLIPTAAIKYTHQAEKLSFVKPENDEDGSGTAIRADYITPQDPVIVTGNGGRLPGVPLVEAEKLNKLRAEIEGNPADVIEEASASGLEKPESEHGTPSPQNGATIQKSGEGSLRRAMPPSRTNPLFPPLP